MDLPDLQRRGRDAVLPDVWRAQAAGAGSDLARDAPQGDRSIHQARRAPASQRQLPGTATGRAHRAVPAGPAESLYRATGLFLLANVLFVAMESIAGSNVSRPARQAPAQPAVERPGTAIVAQHLAATRTTVEAYAAVFDPKVRRMQVAGHPMVLPFALLPPLVSVAPPPLRRARRVLAAFHAFMLCS